jgi:hypothetical protein
LLAGLFDSFRKPRSHWSATVLLLETLLASLRINSFGRKKVQRFNMSSPTDPAAPAKSSAEAVQELYSQLAINPAQEFGWNKGLENAKQLGYDLQLLARMPGSVWESSAAVGNPFAIGPINAGETVVDLGCGAGADLCIASLVR